MIGVRRLQTMTIETEVPKTAAKKTRYMLEACGWSKEDAFATTAIVRQALGVTPTWEETTQYICDHFERVEMALVTASMISRRASGFPSANVEVGTALATGEQAAATLIRMHNSGYKPGVGFNSSAQGRARYFTEGTSVTE
jgi:hypothetical protein